MNVYMFRCTRHIFRQLPLGITFHTKFRLVFSNQSEHCKYNLITVDSTRIEKIRLARLENIQQIRYNEKIKRVLFV